MKFEYGQRHSVIFGTISLQAQRCLEGHYEQDPLSPLVLFCGGNSLFDLMFRLRRVSLRA